MSFPTWKAREFWEWHSQLVANSQVRCTRKQIL
jgi:hypothetical protein